MYFGCGNFKFVNIDYCVQTVFIPLHETVNNLSCKFSEYVLSNF